MSERAFPGRQAIARKLLATAAVAATVAGLAFAGGPAFAGQSGTTIGAGSRSATRTSTIPTGFHAQSLSWDSPAHGWMLGSAPCGQSTCTTVVGTTDGGATWDTLGTLNAPLTLETKSGVTEVRFADDLHGWAFDPALWATSDGGATWRKQTPPGGRPLVAVAADADAAYAVVSGCNFNQPLSECTHPATLWRTTPGQGSWTQASVTLPVANQAVLAVHGVVAYVVVPASLIPLAGSSLADAFDVTTDGQHWSSRPDPCATDQAEFLSAVAPISDTKVALLCEAAIGFGKAEKRVFESNDTGKSTISGGTLNLYGIVSQLAAAPNGTLVVATYSIGSWIYRNAGGQSWTTQVDLGDGGMGWNDVAFTTNQIGFVVHGPATCCGGHGPGELWETEDGGVTWGPI